MSSSVVILIIMLCVAGVILVPSVEARGRGNQYKASREALDRSDARAIHRMLMEARLGAMSEDEFVDWYVSLKPGKKR